MSNLKPLKIPFSHEVVQVDEIAIDESSNSLDTVEESAEQNICELCNKQFATSYCLKRHIQSVHFEVKKFACHICNNDYARKDSLIRHIKNLHSKKLGFNFNTCDKTSYFIDNSSSSGNISSEVTNLDFKICKDDKIFKNEILRDSTRSLNILTNTTSQILMNSETSKSCDKNVAVEDKLCSFASKENKTNYVCGKYDISDQTILYPEANSELSCYNEPKLVVLSNVTIENNIDSSVKLSCLNASTTLHSEANNSEHACLDQGQLNDSKLISGLKYEKIPDCSVGLKCKLCDKNFNKKEDFLNHFHSGPNLHECKFCRKHFSNRYSLKRHEKIHSRRVKTLSGIQNNFNGLKVKKHKCEICDRIFNRKFKLKLHIDNYHNNKETRKHACTICDKAFNDKSTLSIHHLVHTGEKPFVCEICGLRTSVRSSLKRHIRTHTGEKPYKCDICDKSFGSKSTLKGHLRVHTRERPFVCDVCRKTFWRRNELNEHYIIHTGERPFECDVCGKVFKYNFRLKGHYLIHTQEKKYFCETCNRGFKTKFQLKEHIYKHTGEKPYLCDYNGCGKSFRRLTALYRHSIIHAGLQPYICDICKRGFNQKTSLTRHYVVHTKEKPYSCDICNQAFTQKSYLSFHKRKKH